MPPTLPSASPRTVYQVFSEVLRAGDEDTFTQATLKSLGIGQYKQALALLNFFDLLSTSSRLKADVFDVLRQPQKLAERLAERLRRQCTELGCTAKDVAFLGSDVLSGPEVNQRIKSLTPISNMRNPDSQSNCAGCLRALHEMLLADCDREWLRKEVQALAGQGGTGAKPPASRRGSQARSAASGRLAAGSLIYPSDSIVALLQQADTTEIKRYIVGFDEQHVPIYASVWLRHPVDLEQLGRLAVQLAAEAEVAHPGATARS